MKDDGSLCVARNNWLQKADLLKQRLQYAQLIPQLLPKEYEGLNLERVCDLLTVWLDVYLDIHPADRKNFEKVMRTEIKYYRLLEEYGFKSSKMTFQEFPEELLARLGELVSDAKR